MGEGNGEGMGGVWGDNGMGWGGGGTKGVVLESPIKGAVLGSPINGVVLGSPIKGAVLESPINGAVLGSPINEPPVCAPPPNKQTPPPQRPAWQSRGRRPALPTERTETVRAPPAGGRRDCSHA